MSKWQMMASFPGVLSQVASPTGDVTISFTDARSTCSSPICRMKSTLVATVGAPPAAEPGLTTPRST